MATTAESDIPSLERLVETFGKNHRKVLPSRGERKWNVAAFYDAMQSRLDEHKLRPKDGRELPPSFGKGIHVTNRPAYETMYHFIDPASLQDGPLRGYSVSCKNLKSELLERGYTPVTFDYITDPDRLPPRTKASESPNARRLPETVTLPDKAPSVQTKYGSPSAAVQVVRWFEVRFLCLR